MALPIIVLTEPLNVRKTKRNPKSWNQNIRKKKRQSGQEYVNSKGKVQPARKVKPNGCLNKETCYLNCMENVSFEDRQNINDSFWSLDDGKKYHFYSKHVERFDAIRKRTKNEISKKTFTYKYNLTINDVRVRVCREFFLNTLNINKGRILYYFSNIKRNSTEVPRSPWSGRHKKQEISPHIKEEIRNHIKKFPVIESHYCRANSTKQYLEKDLNLAQMYRLYISEVEVPAKLSAYRTIFNSEFNIAFEKPKKDACEKCVTANMSQIKDDSVLTQHLLKKNEAQSERGKDRVNGDNTVEVICFDLQNVFQLPVANASNIFYKRKFSLFNLTASIKKNVYNAIWYESICGREGTHIANALLKILRRVVLDFPDLKSLVLWSDSCVPQNRNSIMSTALRIFLNSAECGKLESIEQKFSESGHSQIQEVDCAHSRIERFFRHKFIYSPLSFIREFNRIPTGKQIYFLLQMTKSDYFDYQEIAQCYRYSVIPYSKLCHIKYIKHSTEILYKQYFSNEQFNKEIIFHKNKTKTLMPTPKPLKTYGKLSAEKVKDIESMLLIMPDCDKEFYLNLIETISDAEKSDDIIPQGRKNTTQSKVPKTKNIPDKIKTRNKKENKVQSKLNKKSAKANNPKLTIKIASKNIKNKKK